ncbi:MAG TPA: hypothetical protein VIN10_06455 [Bacteroidales bacterium]
MKHESIPINRKALKINLDTEFYGSIAEIGGGQETARNFFIAGASSGTVAKSISAYDKSFSDKLYNKNKPGRYVSEGRLVKMLDQEYRELTEVLVLKKESTNFFAFADTVEVLNFAKDNYSHGWMGIKFQLRPDGEPNTVIIHVKLLENDTQLQQKTLGELGVNLIYACNYYYEHPDIFLQSLLDNLSVDRLRITMIRMSGPDLDYVDNRLLGVQLVKFGMTHAIMFDKNGDVQQPSDMLYKKNVLAFRGSFNPITYVAKDILNASLELFQKDEDYKPDNTLSFCEITLNNLFREGEIDERDFLERANMLNDIGQNVMISDIREYYSLVEFFSQFKIQKLRIVMGVPSLEHVFNEKYYINLKGGILEAIGKMFPKNIKIYIYPTIDRESKTLRKSKDIQPQGSIQHLYNYLLENRYILDISSKMADQLHVKSHEVHKMIEQGNPEWEKYVPMIVANKIREKRLFGYSGSKSKG